MNLNSVIVKEAEADGDKCIDLIDWKNKQMGKTCNDYKITKVGFTCERFGYLANTGKDSSLGNTINFRARDSCCKCGGGYRGDLFSRKFRVGLPTSSEQLHVLYKTSDGIVDGSIYSFLIYVAKSLGFGMYDTDFSDEAKKAYPEEYPNQVYERCSYDMSLGNLDFCIGTYELSLNISNEVQSILMCITLAPIWETSRNGNNSTVPLFIDDFFLVTRKFEKSFIDYFTSVFDPFTFEAWMGILGVALLFCFALMITNEDKMSKVQSCMDVPRRVLNICYFSFKSIAAADLSQDKIPNSSEQILAIGFIIFSLIILTAYTGSLAAFLVTEDDQLEYESVSEMLSDLDAQVCAYKEVMVAISDRLPHIDIVPINGTVFDLLDAVDEGKCNAAVVSAMHYERAVIQETKYCDKLRMIIDDVVISIPVGIYFSNSIAPFIPNLREQMNNFILTETYSIIESDYLARFRRYLFDIEQVEKWTVGSFPTSRRLQNGIRGAGTITGFDISVMESGFCDDIQSEWDAVRLNFVQLLFPMLVALLASCSALILYFLSRKSPVLGKDHTQGNQHNVMNDSFTAEAFEKEILSKKTSISGLSPYQIVQALEGCGISEELINAAIDKLPDMNPLHDLLLETKLSSEAMHFEALMNLNISSLYGMVKQNNNASDEHIQEALCADKPKEKLVELMVDVGEHNGGSMESLLNSTLTVPPQNSSTDGSFKSGQFDEIDVENTIKNKETLNKT